ncbi:MAG TPA: glycerophosphodiester phosphodiesterase family protein [Candidatus Nanoperiomorbaceae bacterium]|nr:glycerophosphodiester phosphodiesterase family protein [Candidatus Nanoperiomorbaceae bacterium]HMQ96478.1 glycerophosphodiester phosphodiesterase family protein [Candidatus Nanoperiomorbaceae bacterium]HMR85895.1 glycerophosphodiester phosphodiesterase family protein [Candidatus Nanoperiomorbaceae bacterium]
MAVAFGGYRYGGTTADTASLAINPNSGGSSSGGAACDVGDWMVMTMFIGAALSSTNVPADIAGWTVVRSYAMPTGATSFGVGVWMKRRELGETSYTWTFDGTGSAVYWHMAWYSGADQAYAGTFYNRNGHGTSYTNVAPSITTTVANSLVASISVERTVAAETNDNITVNNAMTKQYYGFSGGDININIADKTMSAVGASGDTTWTYPNTQANNGVAGHIWFTPASETNSGAPQIVGTATASSQSSGTLEIAVPSGYQTGDILIAVLRSQSSVATVDWSNGSFTRVGTAFIANSVAYRLNGFYLHEITGTEPSTYTFTGISAARSVGAILLIRGANPGMISYYDGYGVTVTNGRGVPSYTASDPSLVIEYAASEFSATYDHIPTDYPDNFSAVSEVVTTGTVAGSSRTYMYIGSRELVGSTTTVGRTETDIIWGSVAGASAMSIAIGGADAEDPDFTAKIGDTGNILTDVKVRVGDTGGVLSQVSDMRAMVARYHTVAEMMADDEIYWAHRGGSRDFPEMSSFAYGQSALLGYGCLELSLARTSDGVWFGLHDQDINRTSGTTGLGNASTMTWADVQNYQILGSMATNNPSQPSRPYARLQDILEAYSEHLFVVDVKYANTYREELLNILDSYGGKERFVGKAYGPGTNSFATSCANRGYERWGYFYASDLPSLTAPSVNQWTLIGMDYTASQSDWDTLAAYRTNGQRMMGHICPSSAAVATARSYGATGFMVSGVKDVRPT